MGSNSFCIGQEFSSGTPPCTEIFHLSLLDGLLYYLESWLIQFMTTKIRVCLSRTGVCFITKNLGSYSIMPVRKGGWQTFKIKRIKIN